MYADIEKAFDTAFFNADHQLKNVHQVVANFEDVVLSEDLSAALGGALSTIGTQLSTMAFCFAQLMSKSILYTENYFVLKERFQQLQLENFNFKSDKCFMDFVRKLNLICSNNSSPSKSQTNSFTSPKNVKKVYSNKEGNNSSLTRSPYKRRSNQKFSQFNLNKLKQVKPSTETKHYFQNDNLVYKPPESNVSELDDHLLNNGNKEYLKNSSSFRLHRMNNNAFKLIYRNFKEVELINELNFQNVSLQKEIVVLKHELSNYRLVVRYLNNQMSGRIQQIQLLNREKKDANFDQVWSDLESEIQLNKFKTISQALASNQSKSKAITVDASSLYRLLHNSMFTSNLPAIIKPKTEVHIERVASPVWALDTVIDAPEVPLIENNSIDQLTHSSNVVESFSEEEQLVCRQLANFKPSWFNIGLLRFAFVNLVDEAIGISVIGGKEYDLPIIISDIHENTPAFRSAAFNPGDIILTVNFVDMTDMTHDDAVALLHNLSGNTRFGVIYFKPDEQRQQHQQQLAPWISPSTLSGTPTDWQSGSPGLADMPSLIKNYYRTAFNVFLTVPLSLHSDQSDDAQSDDDNGDDNECPQSSSVCSSFSEKEEEVEESQTKPVEDVLSGSTVNNLENSKVNLSGQASRALPGMAARLSFNLI